MQVPSSTSRITDVDAVSGAVPVRPTSGSGSPAATAPADAALKVEVRPAALAASRVLGANREATASLRAAPARLPDPPHPAARPTRVAISATR